MSDGGSNLVLSSDSSKTPLSPKSRSGINMADRAPGTVINKYTGWKHEVWKEDYHCLVGTGPQGHIRGPIKPKMTSHYPVFRYPGESFFEGTTQEVKDKFPRHVKLDDTSLYLVIKLFDEKERAGRFEADFDQAGDVRPARQRFGPGPRVEIEGTQYYPVYKRYYIICGDDYVALRDIPRIGQDSQKERCKQAKEDPGPLSVGQVPIPKAVIANPPRLLVLRQSTNFDSNSQSATPPPGEDSLSWQWAEARSKVAHECWWDSTGDFTGNPGSPDKGPAGRTRNQATLGRQPRAGRSDTGVKPSKDAEPPNDTNSGEGVDSNADSGESTNANKGAGGLKDAEGVAAPGPQPSQAAKPPASGPIPAPTGQSSGQPGASERRKALRTAQGMAIENNQFLRHQLAKAEEVVAGLKVVAEQQRQTQPALVMARMALNKAKETGVPDQARATVVELKELLEATPLIPGSDRIRDDLWLEIAEFEEDMSQENYRLGVVHRGFRKHVKVPMGREQDWNLIAKLEESGPFFFEDGAEWRGTKVLLNPGEDGESKIFGRYFFCKETPDGKLDQDDLNALDRSEYYNFDLVEMSDAEKAMTLAQLDVFSGRYVKVADGLPTAREIKWSRDRDLFFTASGERFRAPGGGKRLVPYNPILGFVPDGDTHVKVDLLSERKANHNTGDPDPDQISQEVAAGRFYDAEGNLKTVVVSTGAKRKAGATQMLDIQAMKKARGDTSSSPGGIGVQ
ncbi:uncharacterized protein PV07_12583 [Cladophialophora immunda]|uniref:Uncharacterized protein n=1 Tax=Cladophialophora immunda TaxID=569365 RepID=A0A0D1Z344_9EURO|nr:uncharacterized protein PV07_12583 [Cladophialophora immunda]KIW22016.1 hypothetical protein PV07_12583 [Cladophialophora immunda]